MLFSRTATGQDGYTALAASVVKSIRLDFYASANRYISCFLSTTTALYKSVIIINWHGVKMA